MNEFYYSLLALVIIIPLIVLTVYLLKRFTADAQRPSFAAD